MSRVPRNGSAPHVVVLAPGAKFALMRSLADAVAARGGRLTGWERDEFAPAAACCHARVDGAVIDDDAHAEALLSWCREHRVDLVVPTRHGDLLALARAHARFAAAGIALVLSSVETIALCLDKHQSHRWLQGHGFPLPQQATIAGLESSPLRDQFPLVAKDPNGSGSRGVRLCGQRADLAGLPPHWLVQRVALGTEYTVNLYVDRRGRSVTEIPHERILVSEGEVVRGRTAHIPALMDLARRIAESLPGARGPLNVQIFWDAATQGATVIEINPRFGGGYPLAHAAGGRFTDWILAEYLDESPLPRVDAWKRDLLMVRYREAAFFPGIVS